MPPVGQRKFPMEHEVGIAMRGAKAAFAKRLNAMDEVELIVMIGLIEIELEQRGSWLLRPGFSRNRAMVRQFADETQ